MLKHNELQKQIEAYNLKDRLKDIAERELKKQPFSHLPQQFSKGILIGNIAIVPRKMEESRFVYVIADMVSASILYDSINLKQTAILVAHYLADNVSIPAHIIDLDKHFASKIFEIVNFRRFIRNAEKNNNEAQKFIYQEKFYQANRGADIIKKRIHSIFDLTFRYNSKG
tara:strand:+ start:66 stop:575 length:510 start_codon:yes stop_codon:yes gene_type:complete